MFFNLKSVAIISAALATIISAAPAYGVTSSCTKSIKPTQTSTVRTSTHTTHKHRHRKHKTTSCTTSTTNQISTTSSLAGCVDPVRTSTTSSIGGYVELVQTSTTTQPPVYYDTTTPITSITSTTSSSTTSTPAPPPPPVQTPYVVPPSIVVTNVAVQNFKDAQDLNSKPNGFTIISDINGNGVENNKGFHGTYSYITYQTGPATVNNGFTGFRVDIEKDGRAGAVDMAQGTGGKYRFFVPAIETNAPQIVSDIRYWRSATGQSAPPAGFEGWGMTSDINASRGGDFCYVLWKNAPRVVEHVEYRF